MLRNSSKVCPSSFSWRRLVFQHMMYASSSRLNESNESNSPLRWNSSFRVALTAHRLAYVQPFELLPPPLVPVLPIPCPSAVSAPRPGQAFREHGEQAPLPVRVGVLAHVPGDDLLAGHVVHGREVRLGPATPDSVTSVPSLANGLPASKSRLSRLCTRPPVSPLYEWYRLHGFAARIRHLTMRRMTPSALLADAFRPNPRGQAHAHLPVAAAIGRPLPDLTHQRFEVRARRMRGMGQMIEVRGPRQTADPQQVAEPVPRPASSRTTALRSNLVTLTPAGPGLFPNTRPSPRGTRPARASACPWASAATPPRLPSGTRGTTAAVARCSRSRTWTWPAPGPARCRRGRARPRPSSPSRTVCCRYLP